MRVLAVFGMIIATASCVGQPAASAASRPATPSVASPGAAGSSDVDVRTSPIGRPATSSSTPSSLNLDDPHLLAAARWGVSDTGEPFFEVMKGELAAPYSVPVPKSSPSHAAGVTPNAAYGGSALCTEAIYDLALTAFTFDWETIQVCSGGFGQQKVTSWMERSSWSGYRNYGLTGSTSLTNNSFLNTWWTLGCNSTGGYYDYKAFAQGYATGIGYGPVMASSNTLKQNKCGVSPW